MRIDNSQSAGQKLRRVLVTGGNGYLGTELLTQLLGLGVEVFAIANCNTDRLKTLLPAAAIRCIGHDFAAIDAFVQEIQPDAIIHLAAVHAEPPTFDQMVEMLNCGVMLGVALLHGAAACPRPPVFVHAGTYWQFEGDRYAPNTFYAAAKQALHDMLEYYRRVRSIPSTTLVLYDIYGPGDTRPKLWRKIIEAPDGASLPLSEGRQFIEVVEVGDIARAFLHAVSMLLQGELLEPFYAIRSGQRLTLRELIEQVKVHAGLDLTFKWGEIAYWPGQIFDPWQGPILPGWSASVSPVEGISDLIRRERAALHS